MPWNSRLSDICRTLRVSPAFLRRAKTSSTGESMPTSPTATQQYSCFAHSHLRQQADREWHRKQHERRREESCMPSLGGCCMLKNMCGFATRVEPDGDEEAPASVSPRSKQSNALIAPMVICVAREGGRGPSMIADFLIRPTLYFSGKEENRKRAARKTLFTHVFRGSQQQPRCQAFALGFEGRKTLAMNSFKMLKSYWRRNAMMLILCSQPKSPTVLSPRVIFHIHLLMTRMEARKRRKTEVTFIREPRTTRKPRTMKRIRTTRIRRTAMYSVKVPRD